jgi:hypothetical protein
MPVNGEAQNKSRPSRKYLCITLTDDRTAGCLLDFIVGWHKHAKLHRKGRAGRWNAFSLADLLAGSSLTVKQWRRVKPLLKAYVLIEDGGYRGKRSIWTQPTALTNRFLRGQYPTNEAAREALALLMSNVKQVPQAPVDTAPGDNQGQNQGQNPIHSTLPILSTKKNQSQTLSKGKEKKEIDKDNQIKDDQIIPHSAPKSIIEPASAAPQLEQQTEHLPKQAKTDAELYPEIPIPHKCPVKHPKDHYGKRWATFSAKVKADRYAWFLGAL